VTCKNFETKIGKLKGTSQKKTKTEKAEWRVELGTSHTEQEAATTLPCAPMLCIYEQAGEFEITDHEIWALVASSQIIWCADGRKRMAEV